MLQSVPPLLPLKPPAVQRHHWWYHYVKQDPCVCVYLDMHMYMIGLRSGQVTQHCRPDDMADALGGWQ